MLESMHRHMKWLMWIIVGLITVAFVFTFGNYPTGTEAGAAATVNGDVISVEEFNRVYQNMHETYRQMMKDQFNETMSKTLRSQAINELITHRLLIQDAKGRGLRISDEELSAFIIKIPVFSQGGKFNQRIYERYLSRYNLTPAEFEEDQRDYLLRRKLEHLIEESVDVTNEELSALYKSRNPKAKPGDFEKNKASFRQTVLMEKRNAALDAYVRGLKNSAKIKISRNLLEMD